MNNKSPKELVHEYMKYTSPGSLSQMFSGLPNMSSMGIAASLAKTMQSITGAYSSPAIRKAMEQQNQITKQLATASSFAHSAGLAFSSADGLSKRLSSTLNMMRAPHGLIASQGLAKQAEIMSKQLGRSQPPITGSTSIAKTLRATINPLIKDADIKTISNATTLINEISASPEESLSQILKALNNDHALADSLPRQETRSSTVQVNNRQNGGIHKGNDGYALDRESQGRRKDEQGAGTTSEVKKPDWEKITKYVLDFCQLLLCLYSYVFVAAGQDAASAFMQNLITACLAFIDLKDLSKH